VLIFKFINRIFKHLVLFQTSLFLSSLPATSSESTIRAAVIRSLPSVNPTQLKSVVHVDKTRCAFANFQDRASAETAAEAWANGLEIDEQVVNVKWGRSRNRPGNSGSATPPVAAVAS
jgi:pre-mRNA-splicing factor RBM22/SLT11